MGDIGYIMGYLIFGMFCFGGLMGIVAGYLEGYKKGFDDGISKGNGVKK